MGSLGVDGGTLGRCHDIASETGNGSVGTWSTDMPALLGAPIDHVMASGGWRATGSIVLRSLAGFDERPSSADRAARAGGLTSASLARACETGRMSTTDDRRHHRADRTREDLRHRQPAPALRPGLPRHDLDRVGRSPGFRCRRSASRRHSPPRVARPSRLRSPASASWFPPARHKQRSNDTDYPFRAHSAFSHLTRMGVRLRAGLDARVRPEARWRPRRHPVLPRARRSHDAQSSTRTRRSASSGSARAPRWPALPPISALATAHIDTFESGEDDLVVDADEDLTRFVSELRLVKDEYEIAQMQLAVQVTASGFDDIVANLPAIIEHPRGERIVEGVFHQRARSDGNTVGYDTIAASGPARLLPALDPQRRRSRAWRPHPHRRRGRGRQPLHGRHHPHAAGQRKVQRHPAQGLRDGARGGRRRFRGGPAGGEVPHSARSRHAA